MTRTVKLPFALLISFPALLLYSSSAPQAGSSKELRADFRVQLGLTNLSAPTASRGIVESQLRPQQSEPFEIGQLWPRRTPPGFPSRHQRNKAILEEYNRQSLEDLHEIIELAESLKKDVIQYDSRKLRREGARKAERIARLAGKIKSRLKWY